MTVYHFKTCGKCSLSKNVDQFGRNKRVSDGYERICTACRKILRVKYKETSKIYEARNKDRIKYRRKHKENRKELMLKYCNTITGRAHRIFNGAKRRAKEKNIEFHLTLDFIKEKLSFGRCEVTDIDFEIVTKHSLFAPSLDRIDNNKGYTVDNVQMVCCAYNMGKKNSSDEMFQLFIKQAYENMKLND